MRVGGGEGVKGRGWGRLEKGLWWGLKWRGGGGGRDEE